MKRNEDKIDKNLIIDTFYYEPDTGHVKRKINTGRYGKYKKDSIVGSKTTQGYLSIYAYGVPMKVHRVAWLLYYGEWPKNQIDHINGKRDDNRIENLREVSNRENSINKKSHRSGKLVGACFCKIRKKWISHIMIDRKSNFLGYFNTEKEANEAYLKRLNSITIDSIKRGENG